MCLLVGVASSTASPTPQQQQALEWCVQHGLEFVLWDRAVKQEEGEEEEEEGEEEGGGGRWEGVNWRLQCSLPHSTLASFS